MQIDMRIYTVAETKILYFKWDYSLCDFVVQAQKPTSFEVGFLINSVKPQALFYIPDLSSMLKLLCGNKLWSAFSCTASMLCIFYLLSNKDLKYKLLRATIEI